MGTDTLRRQASQDICLQLSWLGPEPRRCGETQIPPRHKLRLKPRPPLAIGFRPFGACANELALGWHAQSLDRRFLGGLIFRLLGL